MELFETTGQVELAEILFEGTRSKGCGVVQFAQISEAETAIGAFCHFVVVTCFIFFPSSQIPELYVWRSPVGYVGLSYVLFYFIAIFLDVRFNDRWHTFTPSAAKGGQVAPMQSDGM